MHIMLETPRLFFRRFTATDDDASLLLHLNSDPEVLKYLHEPALENTVQARHILDTVILPQYDLNLGRLALHLKEDGRFIGWCGLKYRKELDETDLGYRLQKKYWGRGYATESAGACIEYGFEMLALQRIVGRAHVENASSLSVLKKIGMTYLRDEVIDQCPVKTFESCNHSPVNPI